MSHHLYEHVHQGWVAGDHMLHQSWAPGCIPWRLYPAWAPQDSCCTAKLATLLHKPHKAFIYAHHLCAGLPFRHHMAGQASASLAPAVAMAQRPQLSQQQEQWGSGSWVGTHGPHISSLQTGCGPHFQLDSSEVHHTIIKAHTYIT